jgi:hypothetical protein
LTPHRAETIVIASKQLVMNGSVGNLTVLVGDRVACCKLAGRANFNGSAEFKSALQTLQARGVVRFILDLRECVLMDSTFVGVLAKFSLGLAAVAPAVAASRIELLGAGERVDDMLDNLGVKALFGRLASAQDIPADLTPLDLTSGTAHSRRMLVETSLEAHRALMSLSEENRRKFGDVEKCLVEDLKKTPPDPKT